MLLIRNINFLLLVLFALAHTQIIEPDSFKDKIFQHSEIWRSLTT
jgi:hypothetical protein